MQCNPTEKIVVTIYLNVQVDKTLIRKIGQNRNSIVNFKECHQFAFHLDNNNIYERKVYNCTHYYIH